MVGLAGSPRLPCRQCAPLDSRTFHCRTSRNWVVAVNIKTLAKRAARSVGFEVHRITEQPKSEWPQPDTEPPQDEILHDERWFYHALQMANRHYRPAKMQYHRTVYGEDTRIKYMAYFLDVRDQRMLEIGPLEGHHSVILEKMGVRENVSIEARAENLRKCNRIKEKYHLDRTTFLQHDLERLYRGEERPAFQSGFDLVFCLGVLYHLSEPGKALQWFRSQSATLFLGTHYVSSGDSETYIHNGREYRCRRFAEGGRFDEKTGKFVPSGGELTELSGNTSIATQLYENDLLSLLHDCGYGKIHVLGKDLQNECPHITILAMA
jgi:hypothetical protein